MPTREELIAAKQLISTPDKWIQGGSAHTKHHLRVMPLSKGACAWCMAGAVAKIRGTNDWPAIDAEMKGIWRFNDHPNTTHDMVMTKFDELIGAAQQ